MMGISPTYRGRKKSNQRKQRLFINPSLKKRALLYYLKIVLKELTASFAPCKIGCKVQTCKVPLPLDESLSPLAFGHIFLLDPVFSLFYTLPIKKQLLQFLIELFEVNKALLPAEYHDYFA